jgi:hypothetical protein
MLRPALPAQAHQPAPANLRVATLALIWHLATHLVMPPALALANPDVALPGASAQLGVGGGYWVGAWSELRLEASAPGAWSLELVTEEGRLRTGLSPVRARLEVPDAPVLRLAKLALPLTSRRPVQLLLRGPSGERRAQVLAFEGRPALVVSEQVGAIANVRGEPALEVAASELSSDPASWLAGQSLVLAGGVLPRNSQVLAALAGGAQVFSGQAGATTLARLPLGALGIGQHRPLTALTAAPQPDKSSGQPGSDLRPDQRIEKLLRALADNPNAAPRFGPERPMAALGLWAVGGFLLALTAYSLRRNDQRVTLVAAAVALGFGLVGMVAWAPSQSERQWRSQVVIGARGWGASVELVNRVAWRKADVLALPAGVRFLAPIKPDYRHNATLVVQKPWSQLSYWSKPKTALVPLRLQSDSQGLVVQATEDFQTLFVVGQGIQEPIKAGQRQRVQEVVPEITMNLFPIANALPLGSVVGINNAKINEGDNKNDDNQYIRQIVVALPE